MGAHTGSRRCNSSTTSTARLMRTRRPPPATSSAAAAVDPRRPSPPATNNGGAACGKARKLAGRRGDMEAVRRKMEELRRLVPGGACAGAGDEADELLLRAAGYIARLQAQVSVMQLMVDVLEQTRD